MLCRTDIGTELVPWGTSKEGQPSLDCSFLHCFQSNVPERSHSIILFPRRCYKRDVSTTARLIALDNLQSAIFGQKRRFVASNQAMSRCSIRIAATLSGAYPKLRL